MIELIQNLIRIESISGNEAKLVSFFAPWLEAHLGVAPKCIDRNIVVEITGPNFNPKTGTTLLLCSHIDTVSVCNGWTVDPFGGEVRDGKVFGLGANDALASVVSMTYGALNAKDAIKTGRLILAFVCEEEKGNQGFVAIEPKLPRYTYAIFGEPTSLRIGYCMRGSMKVRMISNGKSCHASRPHEGKNAIFQLADDLNKIRSLPLSDSSPWSRATVEPTVVQGGTSENQIPDRIETILDIRTTPERDNDYILKLLNESGVTYEVIRNLRRPIFCDVESPLIQAVKKAVPSTSLYPFGGSCDMAFTKAPSIVFGPGASDRSHSADEFITKEELRSGAEAYASIIKALLA